MGIYTYYNKDLCNNTMYKIIIFKNRFYHVFRINILKIYSKQYIKLVLGYINIQANIKMYYIFCFKG
jgi:hypothetical protein